MDSWLFDYNLPPVLWKLLGPFWPQDSEIFSGCALEGIYFHLFFWILDGSFHAENFRSKFFFILKPPAYELFIGYFPSFSFTQFSVSGVSIFRCSSSSSNFPIPFSTVLCFLVFLFWFLQNFHNLIYLILSLLLAS